MTFTVDDAYHCALILSKPIPESDNLPRYRRPLIRAGDWPTAGDMAEYRVLRFGNGAPFFRGLAKDLDGLGFRVDNRNYIADERYPLEALYDLNP